MRFLRVFLTTFVMGVLSHAVQAGEWSEESAKAAAPQAAAAPALADASVQKTGATSSSPAAVSSAPATSGRIKKAGVKTGKPGGFVPKKVMKDQPALSMPPASPAAASASTAPASGDVSSLPGMSPASAKQEKDADAVRAAALKTLRGETGAAPAPAAPEKAVAAASMPEPAQPVMAAPADGKKISAPEKASMPDADSAGSSPSSGYSVRKGDSLSKLALRYYGAAGDWPRIWEANRSGVRNPHLIYPDQRLALPGMAAKPAEPAVEEIPAPEPEMMASAPAEAVAQEPAQGLVEAPAVAEPVPQKSAPAARYASGGENFLMDAKWAGDGRIVGDPEKKTMLSQFDTVYLDIGASSGVRPNVRGGIYRKGRRVRTPGRRAQYMVRRVGTLQVMGQVGDESSTAMVVNSVEPIQVGDIVKLEE